MKDYPVVNFVYYELKESLFIEVAVLFVTGSCPQIVAYAFRDERYALIPVEIKHFFQGVFFKVDVSRRFTDFSLLYAKKRLNHKKGKRN
jgi:hypothetical protein